VFPLVPSMSDGLRAGVIGSARCGSAPAVVTLGDRGVLSQPIRPDLTHSSISRRSGRATPCARSMSRVTYNHMVVDRFHGDDPAADRLFQALADATRRDILRRVLGEAASVSTVAAHYDMSFAAVQKHVAVLEQAHLVVKERRGREQIVHGDIATVRRAGEQLAALENVWRARVERMSAVLAEDDAAAAQRHDTSTPHPVAPDRRDGRPTGGTS